MIELTIANVRAEIVSYSQQHPNDFGIHDGRQRIPMKKLMKLFEIKKKSPIEKQNHFRNIVNDMCDLELIGDIGKVLVLKTDTDDTTSTTNNPANDEEYGYVDAAPTIGQGKDGRLRPRSKSNSGSSSLSVATEDGKKRRQGYRRRGSVTRYSIVAQDAVAEEYKKHEDTINQFRRDSIKIGKSLENLSIADHHTPNAASQSLQGDDNRSHDGKSYDSSIAQSEPAGGLRFGKGKKGKTNQESTPAEGGAVKRFFRKGRFSLAF